MMMVVMKSPLWRGDGLLGIIYKYVFVVMCYYVFCGIIIECYREKIHTSSISFIIYVVLYSVICFHVLAMFYDVYTCNNVLCYSLILNVLVVCCMYGRASLRGNMTMSYVLCFVYGAIHVYIARNNIGWKDYLNVMFCYYVYSTTLCHWRRRKESTLLPLSPCEESHYLYICIGDRTPVVLYCILLLIWDSCLTYGHLLYYIIFLISFCRWRWWWWWWWRAVEGVLVLE